MLKVPAPRAIVAALLLAAVAPAEASADAAREELTRAEDYFLVGDTATALDKVTRLLDAGTLPADARFTAWILRARCEQARGKGGAAADAFCEALRLDPRWQPDGARFTEAEVASVDRARAAGCGDPAYAGIRPGTASPPAERAATASYLPPPAAGGGGTPWYRKKMVLGLVGGAAAAAAVLALSGGGDDGGGAGVPLPGFPELPAR